MTAAFTLKLHGGELSELPLDRLAAYLKEFALTLGKENRPVFSSIEPGSVVLRAQIPDAYVGNVEQRLHDAQSGNTQSGASKHLLNIEELMLQDGITRADLLGAKNQILASLTAANEPILYSVTQDGEVEGEITGVVGADDTLHISVREWSGRIVKVSCKDIGMALDIAQHLRRGVLRLAVEGKWVRTEETWKPDAKLCYVKSFEVLEQLSVTRVLSDLRNISGNGWSTVANPEAIWRDIRGIDLQGAPLQ